MRQCNTPLAMLPSIVEAVDACRYLVVLRGSPPTHAGGKPGSTCFAVRFGVFLFFVLFVALGQKKRSDINNLENRAFFGFYVFRAICGAWRFFRAPEPGICRSAIRAVKTVNWVVAASSWPVVLASVSFSPSRSFRNPLTSPEASAKLAKALSCAGRTSASCPRSDSRSVASLSPRWLALAA